jgi:hypothetical protein
MNHLGQVEEPTTDGADRGMDEVGATILDEMKKRPDGHVAVLLPEEGALPSPPRLEGFVLPAITTRRRGRGPTYDLEHAG